MAKREPSANGPREQTAESAPTLYDTLARKPWLPALVLAVVTLAAYSPLLRGSFLWDDDAWTTGIAQLLRNVSGLRRIWCQLAALQQYYPLTATTFWLDYHLWGFWTLPYHVENVLLHILAALLFGKLLLRLEVPGAWLAAAVFALHPVMVESAGWITERKNVLSLVLYLGALLVYGRWNSFWKAGDDFSRRATYSPGHRDDYRLACLLALGALLAKTTAFSLPAVILLIGWWKRGQIRWQEDVVPTVPFFALAISLGLVTTAVEKNHLGANGPEWAFSLAERCLIAGRALVFYVGKLLWPANLCFVYPRWQLDVHSAWQWLYPGLAGGTVSALWLARRRIGRGPATAAFFFVGTLFPLLGFMNAYFMRYSFVCDHWVYLPSLGPIALAAAGIVTAFKRFRRKPVMLESTACGTLLVVLAALTWRQGHVYRDVVTLWRDTLAKNPQCWMAHTDLGYTLFKMGKLPEAFGHAQEAVRLNPNNVEAHLNLANALAELGRTHEAIERYQQALRIKPDYAEAHYDLAIVLNRAGRLQEAIEHYEQALRIKPDFAMAHYNLGLALEKLGRMQEAIPHYEQALRINPDFIQAQNALDRARAVQ